MKHQISFLGGQLLPVYIGVKEYMPDKLHFIASEESKEGMKVLKDLLKELKFSEFICDPFDFYAIKKRIESIIEKVDANDDVLINLMIRPEISTSHHFVPKYAFLGNL